MHKHVDVAAGAGAWVVQEAGPRGPQLFDGGVEIGYSQGDVVETGAALLEEIGDGGIGGRRLEQLDARIGGGEHGHVHFFLRDGLAVGHLKAE